jgi:hypothetical protein
MKCDLEVGDVVGLKGDMDEIVSMTVVEVCSDEAVRVAWLDSELHWQEKTVLARALRVLED